MAPLKRAIAWGLERSGALALHRRGFERGRAVILVYHRVNDAGDPFFPALPVGVLAAQLDYVASRYRVESLDAVLDWLDEGAPGPPRVALTLDDGYRDTDECVRPELERRSLPLTLFLATQPPETGQPLWGDQVRWAVKNARASAVDLPELGLERLELGSVESRLRATTAIVGHLKRLGPQQLDPIVEQLERLLEPEGPPLEVLDWARVRTLARGVIQLGAHTHRHYLVSRLEGEELAYEIDTSVRLIEERTGVRVTSFAYPNGEHGDYDVRAIELLRDRGLRSAVTALSGFARPGGDLFQLPRLYTTQPSLSLFALHVAGLTRDSRRGALR